MIKLGAVFELPAELPFAFPGHAREISTEEAEKFMTDLPEPDLGKLQAELGRAAARKGAVPETDEP